ncbi:hypothetical protein LSH36_139g04040 [Paralvinella palmiformis]|uniref:Dienelactone hydrolase domain-containing protein n=1 Tax=Paralvinella palmiformis TaxID=53620 RepID=A0AAD9N7M7_9ANNE|nr:hypothetical protein LSH36_139g04040 [Paralvinella palmiformis]
MAGERIQYSSKHPSGDATGLLFGKPKSGSKGVVLIHEWWGINKSIVDMAKRIQEAGFVVLAADVFRGTIYTDYTPALENAKTFDYLTGSRDILAAVQYLKKAGCSKVGILGFSFGAALAMVSAAALAKQNVIDAVAPLCGVPRQDIIDLTKIKCPVQGHYGSKDKAKGISSPADYNNMSSILWDAKVDLEMCIYDAGHAFPNPDYAAYDPDETTKFYANVFAFFHQKLSS